VSTLLGRLSIVDGQAAGAPSPGLFREAARERTLPVVCRNLGVPCDLETEILARQIRAAHEAAEIRRRVEALPLKGLHLAHRLYPTPALRDMGDIDLLVRRRDLAGADVALRALEYAPDRDPVMAAESGGGYLNAVVYRRQDAFPVHLHWHVSNASLPHFMYGIDVEEIWRESRGGGMARHHLVVTLCEHALKHSYDALIHLTDIDLAARGADASLVRETSRRWGLDPAVQYARELLRDLMGAEPAGLLGVPRLASGGEGRAFLALARARRWSGLSALGLLSMARGLRSKARFVREALAPVREESVGFASRTASRRLLRAAEMVWGGLTWRGRRPAR
jgi:hypothetical protein